MSTDPNLWLSRCLAFLVAILVVGGIPGQAKAVFVLEQWGAASQENNDIVESTFPATPTEGNLLIAIIGNQAVTGPPPTPAGWTLARDDTGNSPGQIIFYKVAGPAEPTSLTIGPYPAPLNLGLHLYEYSGADTNNPLASVGQTSGSGTTVTSGSVNVGQDGSLILVGFTALGGTSYDGWTNGFFEEWDFANLGPPAGRATYAGVDYTAPTAGIYSTTGTLADPGDWIGQALVINPPPPPSVVTHTGNTGYGSLRDAIDYANLNPGTTITFDIPDTDTGYQTSGTDHWWRIAPTSGLPQVTAGGTTIDGSTQTTNWGDVNTRGPEIELFGANAGANVDGLHISGGNALVRSLVINRFTDSGIDLTSPSNTIEGCYIGTNALGTLGMGNSFRGIDIGNVGSNTIGGADPADRNVISGNLDGIEIDDDSDGNKVYGNYIGTDAAGTSPVPNLRHGVILFSGPSGNQIGGAAAGQGNLISGNTVNGVTLDGNGGTLTTLNTIAGNHIGLDSSGNAALGNGESGIMLFGGATVNTIGGNVVSANVEDGIKIMDSGTDNNVIKGNYVGTNVAGTSGLGNTLDGIVIRGGAQGNSVGGTTLADRNIIADNGNDGIWITGSTTTANTVQGNWIGIGVDDSALGNIYHGIGIEGSASNNTIGGTVAGAGNRIANSAWDGIAVANGTGTGNALLGNSIFANGDLAIDHDNDGVGTNDAGDADSGPNGLQNYPVLDSAVTNGSSTITIDGKLTSAGSTVFRLEFFASPAADASGHGEGEIYLGFTNVTTDAGGETGFSAPLAVAVPGGLYISATATDPGGNTSELAANLKVLLVGDRSITGTVFEDADFAGTAQNWDGGTGDVALGNVDVELYDEADAFLASTTTAGSGSFSFTGLVDGNYKVRVRSVTIGDPDTPPAAGLHPTVPATWPYPLPEMTWGFGSALIGGQDPALDDASTGDDAGPGDTWVAVTVNGGDVSSANLGFSYDLVTNEGDDANADNVRSKQGCLRQFIKNSNAIVGVNKTWF